MCVWPFVRRRPRQRWLSRVGASGDASRAGESLTRCGGQGRESRDATAGYGGGRQRTEAGPGASVTGRRGGCYSVTLTRVDRHASVTEARDQLLTDLAIDR